MQFAKYFCDGQQVTAERTNSKYRKLTSIVIPILVVWGIWFPCMAHFDAWDYFIETNNGSAFQKPRWYMSITMIFGSFVAGCTSEGGASIAFPVMTLALGIQPSVARDFSFMIQSVGMVAAAFSILYMKVKVSFKTILYGTIGGIVGMIFGLECVSPILPPPFKKMYFVTIWASFASSLFFLNRYHNRKTYVDIPDWNKGVRKISCQPRWGSPRGRGHNKVFNINLNSIVLLFTGFIGGIFSSVAGSGIDICSFAILTLLFRVTEKTATPTSVVLMGINTVVGFGYREFVMGGVEKDAWGFLFVCAPIVVIGAPLGSIIGSHFHRLTLAFMIYLTDFVQFVGALIVIQPWLSKEDGGKTNQPGVLCLSSIILLLCMSKIFKEITNMGLKLIENIETNNATPPVVISKTEEV